VRARAIPWIGAIGVLVVAFRVRGYTADDAFIVGRYALRIASGKGYTFRDGPPTDGVTSPLWLGGEVLLAAWGVDPVQGAKALGALLGAMGVFIMLKRLVVRPRGWVAACGGALAACVCIPWIMHIQSGLESGLAALLMTLALPFGQPSFGSKLAAFAMPWVRPELVPSTWVGALRQDSLKAGPIPWAVAGLASVALFRWAMFGDPLPLSVHAKPSDPIEGMRYVVVSLSTLWALAWIPTLEALRRRPEWRSSGLAFGVGVVSVVIAGGDWMPGGRLFAPFVPLWAGLFGTGLSRWVRLWRPSKARLLLASVFFLPQLFLAAFYFEQADAVARSRAGAGRMLREWLESHARVVALVDIGFLAYRARWTPVDLGGLTDPEIAKRPGGHCSKSVDVGDLLLRDVDTIVIHSRTPPAIVDGWVSALSAHPVESSLVNDPRLKANFEIVGSLPYASDYYYIIFQRIMP
ncbi:MAG: hypothetical protein NZM37_10215, partial [Sandaracinaceae bacterium]|nr:hypothetical protein [Sandaracinaceae bacterium]